MILNKYKFKSTVEIDNELFLKDEDIYVSDAYNDKYGNYVRKAFKSDKSYFGKIDGGRFMEYLRDKHIIKIDE
jgi:hypothetical protein